MSTGVPMGGGVITGRDGLGNPIVTYYAPVSPPVNEFDALAYYSDLDGQAADPMIQRAINAAGAAGGGLVRLPAGVLTINTPLSVVNAPGVTMRGAGRWATTLQPSATFSGAAVIAVTSSNGFAARDFGIVGASQTYSNNPACDGIDIITSYVVSLADLYIAFMNGWGVKIATSASGTGFSPACHNVFTTRCAGGFCVLGVSPNNSIGAVFTNCAGDQAQANEAFLFQDAVDVQLVNCGGYSKGAGVPTIHIKGGGWVFIGQGDFGATNPGVGPCVLIEAGTGSPSNVALVGNSLEKGSVGVSITSGTDHMIVGNGIYFNQSHGISITGGAGIVISGNTFDGNNQGGGAGAYEVFQNTGSGNPVLIVGNLFRTGQGTGVGQVSQAIHPNGTVTHVTGNAFTGASGANTFSSAPGSARANAGYNPAGVLGPPAVPASGTPLANPYGVDVTVYLTGGTFTAAHQVGGASIGNSTATVLRIGAGQTVTLTYSAAPSWVWIGE